MGTRRENEYRPRQMNEKKTFQSHVNHFNLLNLFVNVALGSNARFHDSMILFSLSESKSTLSIGLSLPLPPSAHLFLSLSPTPTLSPFQGLPPNSHQLYLTRVINNKPLWGVTEITWHSLRAVTICCTDLPVSLCVSPYHPHFHSLFSLHKSRFCSPAI